MGAQILMQLLDSTGWGTGTAPDLTFYLDNLRVNNMRKSFQRRLSSLALSL